MPQNEHTLDLRGWPISRSTQSARYPRTMTEWDVLFQFWEKKYFKGNLFGSPSELSCFGSWCFSPQSTGEWMAPSSLKAKRGRLGPWFKDDQSPYDPRYRNSSRGIHTSDTKLLLKTSSDRRHQEFSLKIFYCLRAGSTKSRVTIFSLQRVAIPFFYPYFSFLHQSTVLLTSTHTMFRSYP